MKTTVAEDILYSRATNLPYSVIENPQCEFLTETLFVTRLLQERTRAERSGRQFALMLLDIHALSSKQEYNLLRSLPAALAYSMRESDIVGWHQEDLVAGVILTEFGDWDILAALPAVKTRVCTALRDHLPLLDVDQLSISFHIFPEEWNLQDRTCAADFALHPDLRRSNGNRRSGHVLKRSMDIVGSLLAIILLSPVFLGIGLLIRLTSPGPVLFRQQRIGQFGVPFTFLKFRSMNCNAESDLHEDYVKRFIAGRAGPANASGLYKLDNDPRVTPVGRFLRRTSLDELPQFFNVLKGEMSLVGPRPPLLYELRAYSLWHRRRLLDARPGITGLWQVSGRSSVRFDEMVRLDLRYAASQSLWLDLCILAKTPWAVISCRGAY